MVSGRIGQAQQFRDGSINHFAGCGILYPELQVSGGLAICGKRKTDPASQDENDRKPPGNADEPVPAASAAFYHSGDAVDPRSPDAVEEDA